MSTEPAVMLPPSFFAAVLMLGREGFTNGCSQGDAAPYIDFDRYPLGWGEDGTDRFEAVHYDIENDCWYGTVRHITPEGKDWYDGSPDFDGTAEEIVAKLNANREVAPKVRAA